MLCCRCKREIPDGSLYCNFCGKRQGALVPKQPKTGRRSPGSGNIHLLPGKRARPYAARIGQSVIGTFETKGEAIVALDQFVAQNRPLDSCTATFAQVFELWQNLHFSEISDKTVKGYMDAFKRSKALHKRKIADLRTSDYQLIIDELVSGGKSYSLCCKQNGLFQQLNSFALERDLISKNYAEFVKLPKKPEPKKRILSAEEQSAIWSIANVPGPYQETARIAVVLFCTGMRIGELLSMKSENVHLTEGYAIGGEKTSAGRRRVIPLPPAIQGIIADWLSNGAVTLVCTKTGTPRDDSHVRHRFGDLMKELKITGVTPHTCRHTAATMMAAAGVAPKAIQTILGHASYSTTATIYTHPQITELVSAAYSVNWNGTGMAQNEKTIKISGA